jgi:CubicO group peptidase (beta-lactamase class C family)
MNDTHLVRVGDPDPRVAHGYRWINGRLTNGFPIAQSILSYPGGGLVSTVRDMAKWDAALYRESPIKQTLLAQMWTPATFNNGKPSTYGFGFGIDRYRGLKRVSHNGAHATGFTSTFMRFLDEKITVIVLTNQRRANTDALATGIAGFYLPALQTPTTALTTNAPPATNRPVLNSGTSRQL